MIDLLLKNKEWLFSGVGVVIIVGIFALLRRRFSGTKDPGQTVVVRLETPQSPRVSIEKTTSSEIPVRRTAPITLLQIHETLRNAPPLQREELREHYKGLYVEWDAYLSSASKEGGNSVRLSLSAGKGMDTNSLLKIFCNVSLHDYKELAILREGAPIRLFGKITKVDEWYVELAEAQLTFMGIETKDCSRN
jgi:hypothetical protein